MKARDKSSVAKEPIGSSSLAADFEGPFVQTCWLAGKPPATSITVFFTVATSNYSLKIFRLIYVDIKFFPIRALLIIRGMPVMQGK
jgi:hypothetical protein